MAETALEKAKRENREVAIFIVCVCMEITTFFTLIFVSDNLYFHGENFFATLCLVLGIYNLFAFLIKVLDQFSEVVYGGENNG